MTATIPPRYLPFLQDTSNAGQQPSPDSADRVILVMSIDRVATE